MHSLRTEILIYLAGFARGMRATLRHWVLRTADQPRLPGVAQALTVADPGRSGQSGNADGVLSPSPGLACGGGATPGNKLPTCPNPNKVALGLDSSFGACNSPAATLAGRVSPCARPAPVLGRSVDVFAGGENVRRRTDLARPQALTRIFHAELESATVGRVRARGLPSRLPPCL